MVEIERDGLPDAPDLPAPPAIDVSPAPPATDDAPYDELAVSSAESLEPELPRALPPPSSGIDARPPAAEPPAPRPTVPTGPYSRAPSVADLMAELEQAEAAAAERSWTWLQAAASRLIELDQRKATLSAHRDPADPMRSHFLEAARQAASKAGQLLDEKKEAEGQEAVLREQLLEAFLALERLIGELDGGATASPEEESRKSLAGKTASPQKPVPAQALRAEALLRAERARRRRIIAVGAIIAILVLVGVGLYLLDQL